MWKTASVSAALVALCIASRNVEGTGRGVDRSLRLTASRKTRQLVRSPLWSSVAEPRLEGCKYV